MSEIKKLKYFAGGQWLDSETEKFMNVYNPSTGEVIAQTPCCTKSEVEQAIAAAKEAQGLVECAGVQTSTGAVQVPGFN